MRNWILRIHLYGGLLCAPYLVIFGVSSLYFNHPFAFMQACGEKVTWEEPLKVDVAPENAKAAEAIRNSLGLVGWLPPRKMRRDGDGNFQFDLERPGKGYTVHALAREGRVRVEERRKGFWPVFIALHGRTDVPGSSFSRGWGWYTELCTWVMLFAAGSGVWLWAVSKRERRAGGAVLALALAASLGLILWVTFVG